MLRLDRILYSAVYYLANYASSCRHSPKTTIRSTCWSCARNRSRRSRRHHRPGRSAWMTMLDSKPGSQDPGRRHQRSEYDGFKEANEPLHHRLGDARFFQDYKTRLKAQRSRWTRWSRAPPVAHHRGRPRPLHRAAARGFQDECRENRRNRSNSARTRRPPSARAIRHALDKPIPTPSALHHNNPLEPDRNDPVGPPMHRRLR